MRWFFYTLCLWLVPTGIWVWVFDTNWVPLPDWAPPWVLGLILERKYHEIQRRR